MITIPCETCIVSAMCKQGDDLHLIKLIESCPILREFIKAKTKTLRKKIIVVRKLIRFYNVEKRYQELLTGKKIQSIYIQRCKMETEDE